MPGPLNTKLRNVNQAPYEPGESAQTRQWKDAVTAQLNALLGQQVQLGQTGQGLDVLSQSVVNPTQQRLVSLGGRTQSITTAFAFVAASNSITFYWDGTNGSVPLQIYRDDGTVTSAVHGSFTVSGLAINTTYFFYPFWQENVPPSANFGQHPLGVNWATIPHVSVGTPPVAFLAQNIPAAQIQIARDHIPLALGLSTTGAKTGTGSGSGGGGGGGGGGFGCPIAGTILHQMTGPLHATRLANDEWIKIILNNGLLLQASPKHQVYALRGKTPLDEIKVGDWVVTAMGESPVTKVQHIKETGEKLVVEVPRGHLYWANGILSHNFKPV